MDRGGREPLGLGSTPRPHPKEMRMLELILVIMLWGNMIEKSSEPQVVAPTSIIGDSSHAPQTA